MTRRYVDVWDLAEKLEAFAAALRRGVHQNEVVFRVATNDPEQCAMVNLGPVLEAGFTDTIGVGWGQV